MSGRLYATTDNAEGQLSAGITGASTSIVVQTGEGAEFPQPYTGSASSAGDATTLNDTGDLGNLAVGDFIENITDGSWAFVTVAGTNSVTTTRLQGGTANIWDNADEWQVNAFVITLEKRDSDGDVTQREKVLIKDRSTDDLTVRTRGYDGSSAQSFATNDYVNLHVTSILFEEMIDAMYDLAKWIDTNETDIDNVETGSTFYAASTGSANAYVVTLSPALSAYAAGNIVRFKANFANTGSATVNVNGLGAKTIKKEGGTTNLAANDIENGQLVILVYDGTNFQMMSMPATVVNAAPTGSMQIWTTDSAPTGWLLCYGQAVSRTTYAGLFAVISTVFGSGDGSTTFNLPDMRGRFPLGQDDMGGTSANRVADVEADTIGSSQGSDTYNLQHTHGITTPAVSSGSGGTGASSPTGNALSTTQDVMNPYLTLNYIIKT